VWEEERVFYGMEVRYLQYLKGGEHKGGGGHQHHADGEDGHTPEEDFG